MRLAALLGLLSTSLAFAGLVVDRPGCFVPDPGAFTSEELVRDLRLCRPKVTHPLGFFNCLKHYQNRYRSLLLNPVFEKSSGAIHSEEVSSKYPRIVLHGGNLTLHLTSDPTRRGHLLIEIAEFVPDENRTAFRVISLAEGPHSPEYLPDAEEAFQNPTIRAAYEKKLGGRIFACSECHIKTESGLIPNWYLPSSAFRTFGGSADRISARSKDYRDFLDLMKRREAPSSFYHPLSVRYQFAKNGDIVFPGKPVQSLTKTVYNRAYYNAAAAIIKNPLYAKLQYATIGAFLGCNISTFFPDDFRIERENQIKEGIRIYPFDHFVPASLLRDAWIKPAFRRQYRHELVQQGNRMMLRENRFLEMTSLPFIKALSLHVIGSNEGISVGTGKRMPPEQMARHREVAAETVSPLFVSTMAALRFLYDIPTATTLPAALYPIGELVDTDGEAGMSLRFAESLEGLRGFAACYLGTRFLQDNSDDPELLQFRGAWVHPSTLTEPLPLYCRRLKAKSLDALSQ